MKKMNPDIRGRIVIFILFAGSIVLFFIEPFENARWLAGATALFAFFLVWARFKTKDFNNLPELIEEVIVAKKNILEKKKNKITAVMGAKVVHIYIELIIK